jgi:predicted component of type VI protein secretion system
MEITRIGKKSGSLYTLGRDTFLGNRIWMQGSKVNIIIKDAGWDTYEKFNKYNGGELYFHMKNLCLLYIPQTIKVNYFIEILDGDKKGVVLGAANNLGFNTWISNCNCDDKAVQIYT